MKIIKNLSLILFSIIISIVIIEIFLKIFFPQPLSGTWRIQNKNGLWLNKQEGSAKHEFYYNDNKISVRYDFGEYHNRIFKNLTKKTDRPKILILGDSFTFGWLLEDKNTFVYKIQKNYEEYEIINAAAGGWGTSDFLSYIKTYCKIIKPKEIIIFYNSSDNMRSINSNLYKLENNRIVEKKNKISKLKKKLNDFDYIYNFLVENFQFIQLLRKIYNLKSDARVNVNTETKKTLKEPITKNEFEFLKKLYLELYLETTKCNTNLNIVELSWPSIVVPQKFLKLNEEIKNFLIYENINFLSLKNEMDLIALEIDNYSIPLDTHPNIKGSNFIYESFIKKQLFEKFNNE